VGGPYIAVDVHLLACSSRRWLLGRRLRVSFLLCFSNGSSGVSAFFGSRCRSLLTLLLSGRTFVASSFAGYVRYFWSFADAFRRDHSPQSGGSVVVMEVVVGASGLTSSTRSTVAASVGYFLCHRRSSGCRWSFNVLSTSCGIRGVGCCGKTKAWSCSSILVGECLSGGR
jgi:hypothetical protein